MSTNGKRNKNAGHAWEREVVKMLKEIGFEHVVTSRSESKGRDAQKVDVINKDEGKNGRLEWNIQAKNLSKVAIYTKLLSELPQEGPEINVIFHKQTKKSGERFVTTGTYALLKLTDFLSMMKKNRYFDELYKIVLENIDYVPDEERPEIEARLKKLGL